MRLAAASARVQPERLPWASSRLARAMAALNDACARSSARLTEAGVGCRSSCAPIDCGAIGPAPGFPADCRTAFSNRAILLLQGPACADAALRAKAAPTTKAAINRRFMIALRLAARLAARHAKRRVARRCQSSSAGALWGTRHSTYRLLTFAVLEHLLNLLLDCIEVEGRRVLHRRIIDRRLRQLCDVLLHHNKAPHLAPEEVVHVATALVVEAFAA